MCPEYFFVLLLIKRLNHMSKAITILLACLLPLLTEAQNISLEQAYEAAEVNYPLVKQRGLLQRTADYSLKNVAKGALPQLSVSGQASYQSDVTSIPISLPGVSIPEQNKDQYRIYGEAVQPLTDLITVKRQKNVQTASNEVSSSNLEVELYK